MDTYLIKRLEQAKLLSDPFKLKLIEEFADKPITTKQVADRLGEKAPRLYRHVDALVAEGMLVLIEERPKRGTIERYYKTIAKRFEVDPELFSGPDGDEGDARKMIRSLFRNTESDLVELMDIVSSSKEPIAEEALLIKFSAETTPDKIACLRKKLENWIKECESLSEDKNAQANSVSYSGMVAFYPQAK